MGGKERERRAIRVGFLEEAAPVPGRQVPEDCTLKTAVSAVTGAPVLESKVPFTATRCYKEQEKLNTPSPVTLGIRTERPALVAMVVDK